MTNLEKLFAFFEAENQRDWQTYETFLSDHVSWELEGDTIEIIQGKAGYLTKIQQVYHNNPVQFRCTYYQLSPDQNRIVTILENDVGDLSCDIFFFEKGMIVKEIEYLLKKRTNRFFSFLVDCQYFLLYESNFAPPALESYPSYLLAQ